MPKRKNSTPIRFRQPVDPAVASVNDDSSPPPKTKCTPLKKPYRRKVIKKTTLGYMFLGEVNLHMTGCTNCDEFSEKFDLVWEDSDEGIHLILVTPNVAVPLTTDISVEVFSDLWSPKCVWVLKEVNISVGIVNINIFTSPKLLFIKEAANLVKFFFGKEYPTYEHDSSHNIECTKEFFKEVQDYQRSSLKLIEKDVQHEKLNPILCPYQAKAVRWMIGRESSGLLDQNADWLTCIVDKFQSKSGKTLYYNKYSEVLSFDLFDFPPLPRGGILADEMGLGKTVVVIALILNHERSKEDNDNENYILPEQSTQVTHKSSSEFYNDVEVIHLNKETCLNAHEKLVCMDTKQEREQGGVKRALTAWYETTLAEYSFSSPTKKLKTLGDTIKCLCGDTTTGDNQDCVQCPGCNRFQHSACVGYEEGLAYFCPPCWTKQKLVKSGGTLIVAPMSLYQQWYDELTKHISLAAFKKGIFMYNGSKDQFIQPSVMATFDIVITTYSTLRTEIHYAAPVESSRRLRNEERFLKHCSPLTQIHWWRLCLDEAQMVEANVSMLKEMAKLTPSVNRWSVTGTPIQKSVNDIYSLIDFLHIEPFNEKPLWDNFLYLPFLNGFKIPLYSVIGHVFWRNSKDDVSDELIIPKQTVRYHLLKFTAIEQNFYMREHATSSSKFADVLQKSNIDENETIESIDKTILGRLLAPLLNLRQACSHPLAARGNIISAKKKSMTLTELLEYLHKKTKAECEEGMRKQILAINGLAAVCCIKNDWPGAVELYRQVLQFAEEYKEKIDVDKLQRIHALTNLYDILRDHRDEGIPPTLRDDNLKSDAQALEDAYMEKVLDEVTTNENIKEEMSGEVSDLERQFRTGQEIWWSKLINTVIALGSTDLLLDRITAELSTNEKENKKNTEMFLHTVSSIKGVEVMLRNWVKTVQDNRSESFQLLEKLKESSLEDLVNQAVNCHIRRSQNEPKKKKPCKLCQCESALLDYECSLFAVTRKALRIEYGKKGSSTRKLLEEEQERQLGSTSTKGAWKAHNAERVLRTILAVGKGKNFSSAEWEKKDGRVHLQLLDAMKKEFKQLRVVWMSINHHVLARDEVSMCKMRMRLRFPGEEIPPKEKNEDKTETILVIDRHEVELQKMKLESLLELSRSEFKKKYGTLLYLGNLGQKENPKPDPCPVCSTSLELEWCVLQCGHSYCIECVQTLFRFRSCQSISCPVCREITKRSDLSFVELTGRQENSEFNVVGEHSTKIDAIVRTLFELCREDPKVKVLIFSSWMVVLQVLSVALSQNKISFRWLRSGVQHQTHLQQFKDESAGVTVLLIPLAWGSKGLNLTEASHVFLVEPIMNPAEELQAIGRVHRMGQTKETVVHRFLISGTIEEKIHAAVSEAKDKWDKKKATLKDLRDLFTLEACLLKREPSSLTIQQQ